MKSLKHLPDGTLKGIKDSFSSNKFLHISNGLKDCRSFFGWQKVSEIVNFGQIENPRLRISQVDVPLERLLTVHKKVPTRRQTFSEIIQSDKVHSLLQEGGTLIIDKVEAVDPTVRGWVTALAKLLGLRPQANFYGSVGHHPGFGIHWDDHDVLVLNLEGEKHWQVWKPTRESPTYRDTKQADEPHSAPFFDKVIQPGDVLFIPRGYWHNVIGVDTPCAHLSLGFEVFNGLELVRQILDDELRDDDLFRKDAPIWSNIDQQKKYLESLSNAVSKAIKKTTVKNELRNKQIRTEGYTNVSLPWGALNTAPDYSNFVFSWLPIYRVEFEESAEDVSFKAFGKKLRFSKLVLPALKKFESSLTLSFSEIHEQLPSQITQTAANSFIHTLVKQGIVSVGENTK